MRAGGSGRGLCTALAAAAALASAGCARTEVLLGVITDIEAPNLIDEVRFQAFRGGQTDADQVADIDFTWLIPGTLTGREQLPGSFGLYSPDGSETKVEVVLTGMQSGTAHVERRSLFSLVSGKTLFLRMALVVSCMDTAECPSGQTCIEGSCKDKFVDSRTLPVYREELVTSVECGGSSFRNTATHDMIMSANGECAGACVEGTCYLPPPGDDGGSLSESLWAPQPTPTEAQSQTLRSVWGVPGGDVYAISDGLILRQAAGGAGAASSWVVDGTAPEGVTLTGVSGTSTADVWAVGSNATILHRTADGWTQVQAPEASSGTYDLAAIACHPEAKNTPCIAVGVDSFGNGTVLEQVGESSGWFFESSFQLPAGALTGVAYLLPDQAAIVVGEGGLARVWNLETFTWEAAPDPPQVDFTGVFGDANGGYVIAANGAIYSVGQSFQLAQAQGGVDGVPLRAITGSGLNNVYVVGDSGTILHSVNGGPFVREETPTTQALYGVWAGSNRDIYAVGAGGTLLHSTGTPDAPAADAGTSDVDLSRPNATPADASAGPVDASGEAGAPDLAPPADLACIPDAGENQPCSDSCACALDLVCDPDTSTCRPTL